MKKIVTLIVLCALTLNAAHARKFITFGPKVGANFNFASGSDMLKPGNIGYSFGIFVEIRPVKFLSISADVLYSKEGFKLGVVDYQGVNTTVNYNLGYLNIPILANFYIWKGLNIKAGIQPSIKLSGKTSVEGSQSDITTGNFSSDIKNGNFAIPVGIGYSFDIGLTIDVRYNISTTKIVELAESGSAFSSRVLTATIGWKF